MHEFAGNDAQWDQAKERLAVIASETGLDAAAVAARLEAGAGNQYLEQMWMHDDIQRLAKAASFDLNDPVEQAEAIAALGSAYQEVREDFVPAHVLHPVAHTEADYLDANGERQITQAERDSISDQFGRTDFNFEKLATEEARDVGEQKFDEAVIRFTEFAGESPKHAAFASGVWDNTAGNERVPVGYLREEEREREHEPVVEAVAQDDPFAKWADRSSDRYSLTKTAADHQEVMHLLRENTTDAQFNRFRTGDLSGIEHITTDPVFSRQLLAEVEGHNRANGFDLTREQELRMPESRDSLKAEFEDDRDHGYER
jgi:hypothetical protein